MAAINLPPKRTRHLQLSKKNKLRNLGQNGQCSHSGARLGCATVSYIGKTYPLVEHIDL